MIEREKEGAVSYIQKKQQHKPKLIPFSAFWPGSSLVSVLISLISDMWDNGSHDIRLIFLRRRAHYGSIQPGLSSVALALHYCKGLAHATQSSWKISHAICLFSVLFILKLSWDKQDFVMENLNCSLLYLLSIK